MAAGGFMILIRIAVGIQIRPQDPVLLIEEVVLAYGNVIEGHSVPELGGKLGVGIRVYRIGTVLK